MVNAHFYVEMLLVETHGAFGNVGRSHLVCRFAAILLPGSVRSAHISVLARKAGTDAWVEYAKPLDLDLIAGFVARIEAFGAAGRRLDVEGRVDTADIWAQIICTFTTTAGSATHVIGMQASGFFGPDADELRELFRDAFFLADFRDYSESIYGRSEREQA